MKDGAFIELLKETFVKSNPEYHVDRQPDYEPLGIRMIQKYCGSMDPRTHTRFDHKSWVVNGETYTDPSSGEAFKSRWDMSTDGQYLVYRTSNPVFYVIEVERMDPQEVEWVLEPVMSEEELTRRRLELVDTLATVLVNRMMSFSRLFTGELETQHRVHLRMIQKGMHQHMRYKPRYGDVKWLRNGVLPWGCTVGWDITVDGRIACCRVDYDEYYDFLIQPLTDEQVDFYRRKHGLDRRSELAEAIGGLDDAKAARILDFLRQVLAQTDKDAVKAS